MKKIILSSMLLLGLAGSASAQWTTVCGTGNDMVVSFAQKQDTMYATGFFTNICGTAAPYIAKWDGTNWYGVDTGLSDAGHNVRVLDNELYVAQYRQTVDSNWVLKWDGSHLVRVGNGVYLTGATVGTSRTANLYDMAKYGGRLYVSGEFDVVDTTHISGIMQWNGTAWDSVGPGLGGSIDGSGIMYPHQLLVYGGDLYVVGNFATAGGITVNGIARWDGSAWHAMGAGFDKQVYAIGIVNNEIYVGGEFTSSGGTALQRIAKWNGSAWVNPGFGVQYSNPMQHAYVHTIMQVHDHGVFEGGFDKAVDGSSTHVAHSVIAWSATGGLDTLSGGIVNGEFEGLAAYHDTVIMVGGAIFAAGSGGTTHVAKYTFAPVSVGLAQVMQGVGVSPNPFTDRLNVSGVAAGSKVRLMNMMGQVVSKDMDELGGLAAGVYVLQVMGDDGKVGYVRVEKE